MILWLALKNEVSAVFTNIGRSRYKKAHVVLNDYVDNSKLMLSDGK